MNPKGVVVLGLIALAGAAALSARATRTVAAPRSSVVMADIALFERRAAEDPQSAADRSQLAGLYLQRGRETGEYADFQRAEKFARAALSLRAERNSKAKLVLASSLLAQHRFADARVAADALVADDPQSIGKRALLAEILLELGDYAAADAEFNALTPFSDNLALAPRLARWYELHGRNEQAHELLVRALEQSRARLDLPAEQVAWFHLRVADYALRNGALREAERAIKDGLTRAPGDYRLHAAYARYFAAFRDWTEVLREVDIVGDRADLTTLALAGDAAHQLGDDLRAREYYDRVAHNARSKPEPFARQWTQFCLEHGIEAERTLQTLRAESQERSDVLGYELLAWAEHQAGNTAPANRALDAALRLGTRDAMLHFIAAEVRLGTADRVAARTHLRTALEINPRFHPIFADSARHLERRLGN
jgi:tetratricopeptide (TPR) repeat protein